MCCQVRAEVWKETVPSRHLLFGRNFLERYPIERATLLERKPTRTIPRIIGLLWALRPGAVVEICTCTMGETCTSPLSLPFVLCLSPKVPAASAHMCSCLIRPSGRPVQREIRRDASAAPCTCSCGVSTWGGATTPSPLLSSTPM